MLVVTNFIIRLLSLFVVVPSALGKAGYLDEFRVLLELAML